MEQLGASGVNPAFAPGTFRSRALHYYGDLVLEAAQFLVQNVGKKAAKALSYDSQSQC